MGVPFTGNNLNLGRATDARHGIGTVCLTSCIDSGTFYLSGIIVIRKVGLVAASALVPVLHLILRPFSRMGVPFTGNNLNLGRATDACHGIRTVCLAGCIHFGAFDLDGILVIRKVGLVTASALVPVLRFVLRPFSRMNMVKLGRDFLLHNNDRTILAAHPFSKTCARTGSINRRKNLGVGVTAICVTDEITPLVVAGRVVIVVILVSGCRNRTLRNKYRSANRALLALGKAGHGTGRSYSGKHFLGVRKHLDFLGVAVAAGAGKGLDPHLIAGSSLRDRLAVLVGVYGLSVVIRFGIVLDHVDKVTTDRHHHKSAD